MCSGNSSVDVLDVGVYVDDLVIFRSGFGPETLLSLY